MKKSEIRFWTRLTTPAFLAAFLAAAILPAGPARAQTATTPSYSFEECENVDSTTLRDDLNRITQGAFAQDQSGLDVAALVDRGWAALDLDAVVDGAVEAATQRVMDETELWDRFISGWSPAKAEELSASVANYAFGSSDVRDGFDLLSLNVSDDIVAEIRLVAARSASSALLCVQTFLGDTISPTMAAVLEKEIQTGLDGISPTTDEEISFLNIARDRPQLLGGVGIVIASQVAKNLGKRLSQQMAGKVLGRLLGRVGSAVVPVAGWIIGAVLIVRDLWNAREGSLPRIRDALQDEEVKRELRQQIAQGLREELRVELPLIARAIANDVYSLWQEFRSKHARVLELGAASAPFQEVLDRTPVQEVRKLAEIVHILEGKSGPEELESLIEQGLLDRLMALPEEALDMLDAGIEPAEVVEWGDLAGEGTVEVVRFELFLVASPSDFRDRGDLARILALESAQRIQKAVSLERELRDAVLELSSSHVVRVLDSFSSEELSQLAGGYLAVLGPRARNILVERLLDSPELWGELNVDSVRTELLNSQDFETALNYVGRKHGGNGTSLLGQVFGMLADLGPALLGEIPPKLLWRYDGKMLLNLLYGLAGAILLYLVWRRLFPPRGQDVNVTVVVPHGPREEDKSPVAAGSKWDRGKEEQE